MASVTAFIRVSKKSVLSANVRFRLSDGRNVQLFHKSELTVNPAHWDGKKQDIKAKVVCDAREKAKIVNGVPARKSLILDIYNSTPDKSALTSEWLEREIDKRLLPEKYMAEKKAQTFFEAFDEFLNKHKLSDVRKNNFRSVYRALQRYEIYESRINYKSFELSFGTVTAETLRDIEDFLQNEHLYFKKYPDIYASIPEARTPQKRGQNTVHDILTKIRTLFLWAVNEGKTSNNPFKNYSIGECVYGTPFYITISERNKIYSTDLSHRPELAVQRDIFVFQCMIGCRVGDFYKMTLSNIINGAVEYIPRKTKDGHPVTVRVPLNDTANGILQRYEKSRRERQPAVPVYIGTKVQ